METTKQVNTKHPVTILYKIETLIDGARKHGIRITEMVLTQSDYLDLLSNEVIRRMIELTNQGKHKTIYIMYDGVLICNKRHYKRRRRRLGQ